MGNPDPRHVIRGLEGSLCYGPTDADTDFPHGGTALGLCRDMVFRFGEHHSLVRMEEFGNVVGEGYRVQDSPVFAAVLREWHDDSFAAVAPDTETGDTGRMVMKGAVDVNRLRSGQKLSDMAVKLLFSPKSLDQHPFIILYNAIPVLMESVLDTRLDREVGVAVAFYGIPDGSGRLWRVCYRGDVEL